jgi:hypothetical protein
MCILLGFVIEMTAFQQLKLKISLNRARSSASTIVYFTLSHFVSSKMFGHITTNSLKFVGKGIGKQNMVLNQVNLPQT